MGRKLVCPLFEALACCRLVATWQGRYGRVPEGLRLAEILAHGTTHLVCVHGPASCFGLFHDQSKEVRFLCVTSSKFGIVPSIVNEIQTTFCMRKASAPVSSGSVVNLNPSSPLFTCVRFGWPPADEILSWDALYVPQTFEGFSSFFGVAVFSYGATIIILEIQAREISDAHATR